MSVQRDYTNLGTFYVQHHDRRYEIDFRKHLRFARFEREDSEGVFWPEPDTISDWLSTIIWKYNDYTQRVLSAFGQCLPFHVMAPEIAKTKDIHVIDVLPVFKTGINPLVGVQSDKWAVDNRFRKMFPGQPRFAGPLPHGWGGVVIGGTHEYKQEELAIPGFYGLISANRDVNFFEMGTRVFDLDDGQEPDEDRWALLQAFWKVIRPRVRLPGNGNWSGSRFVDPDRNALAMQYANSQGSDFAPGFMMVYAHNAMAVDEVSEGMDDKDGGREGTDKDGGRIGGRKRREETPKESGIIMMLSAEAGGPNVMPREGACEHLRGETQDKQKMYAGHLHINSIFYNKRGHGGTPSTSSKYLGRSEPIWDCPLFFENEYEPESVGDYPGIPTRVHLMVNRQYQYPHHAPDGVPGDFKHGMWHVSVPYAFAPEEKETLPAPGGDNPATFFVIDRNDRNFTKTPAKNTQRSPLTFWNVLSAPALVGRRQSVDYDIRTESRPSQKAVDESRKTPFTGALWFNAPKTTPPTVQADAYFKSSPGFGGSVPSYLSYLPPEAHPDDYATDYKRSGAASAVGFHLPFNQKGYRVGQFDNDTGLFTGWLLNSVSSADGVTISRDVAGTLTNYLNFTNTFARLIAIPLRLDSAQRILWGDDTGSGEWQILPTVGGTFKIQRGVAGIFSDVISIAATGDITVSRDIEMGGQEISGLADGVDPQDAATVAQSVTAGAAALAAHVAAADPHTGYQKESEKGAASGYASLSAGSLVVENPANATATPTAGKIPIADGGGTLDGWITAAAPASTIVAGIIEIATAAEVVTATDATRAVSPSSLARAQASGVASLDASSLVVQNPANATATPTASKIVIADGGGKVDGWVSAAAEATAGKVELATQAEVDAGASATTVVTPATLRATLKHRAEMTRAAAQSINDSTTTKIAFDTVVYDVIGGVADATTNDRFNITRTGYYLVSAHVYGAGIDDAEYSLIYIYRNGAQAEIDTRWSPATNSALEPRISHVMYLTSGDYLELYTAHNEGAAINTATTAIRVPKMSIAELL